MRLREYGTFILQDSAANADSPKGRVILVLFRLAQIAHTFPPPLMVFRVLWLGCYQFFVDWLLGVELPSRLRAGEGLRLYHGHALVVHEETVLGRNVTLRHGTTIGTKENGGPNDGAPRIGDNVEIGANATILGPITIGNDAIIGAGAVVTKDVPPYAVVAGNPARLIRIRHDADAADIAAATKC